MKKLLPIAFAAILGGCVASAAQAAAVVNGSVFGPDDSQTVKLKIADDAGSTLDIKSIQFNGNTAASFPLVWHLVGPSTGPDQFGQLTFIGEDSRVLTVEFITTFNPGETFELGPIKILNDATADPVKVSSLLGVEVLFTFSDNSTALYEFIDDPAREAGLILGLPGAMGVPEPGTLTLMGAGLAVLGFARRTRRWFG